MGKRRNNLERLYQGGMTLDGSRGYTPKGWVPPDSVRPVNIPLPFEVNGMGLPPSMYHVVCRGNKWGDDPNYYIDAHWHIGELADDRRCPQCHDQHNLARYHQVPGYADRQQRQAFEKKYNITEERWSQEREDQDCSCAGCLRWVSERRDRDTHTDHCHHCGDFRAILCRDCNRQLTWDISPQVLWDKLDGPGNPEWSDKQNLELKEIQWRLIFVLLRCSCYQSAWEPPPAMALAAD